MKFFLTQRFDVGGSWKVMEKRDGFHFYDIDIPIEIVAIEESEESQLFVERFQETVLKEVGAASTNTGDSSSSSETTTNKKLAAKLAILCKLPSFEAENTFMQFQNAGVIQGIERAAVCQGISLTVKVDVKYLYILDTGASNYRSARSAHISSKGLILDYTKKYGNSGGCSVKFKELRNEAILRVAESYQCAIGKIAVTCSAHAKQVNVPKKILDKEILTDTIIKTADGESVKCHRSFLAAQSSVFQRMFENELKEANTGVIEIPDLSGDGARALLRYLYLQCATKPTEKFEIAVELLKAGHKYDIELLEKQMANIILGQPETWLDLETSISLFKFIRNLEGYESIKLKVVAFMKKNAGQLMNSPEYTALFDEDRAAAMELCSLAFSI